MSHRSIYVHFGDMVVANGNNIFEQALVRCKTSLVDIVGMQVPIAQITNQGNLVKCQSGYKDRCGHCGQ